MTQIFTVLHRVVVVHAIANWILLDDADHNPDANYESTDYNLDYKYYHPSYFNKKNKCRDGVMVAYPHSWKKRQIIFKRRHFLHFLSSK